MLSSFFSHRAWVTGAGLINGPLRGPVPRILSLNVCLFVQPWVPCGLRVCSSPLGRNVPLRGVPVRLASDHSPYSPSVGRGREHRRSFGCSSFWPPGPERSSRPGGTSSRRPIAIGQNPGVVYAVGIHANLPRRFSHLTAHHHQHKYTLATRCSRDRESWIPVYRRSEGLRRTPSVILSSFPKLTNIMKGPRRGPL